MLGHADIQNSDQYRPPGRSNRSGRAQADNDVFEGLPVKQWGQAYARISMAPPVVETVPSEDDKWGDPPMPRDFQFLQPWTQQLLRLARGGKIGTKRKADAEPGEDEKVDDEAAEELKHDSEERGFVARKWKLVPEASLEPEHKRFDFLAKRRDGLPGLYGMEAQSTNIIPMRKTKVLKANADGDVTMYEVLVPEGQNIEGEVSDSTEIADIKPTIAAPGTVVEGLGIANDEGVIVAEHLRPAANSRRSRPPNKKKGGPGRGKKRVTFTNPDGSTYTTVVPNASKIVPQPGQTVKHVAKGEEAGDDVTAEEAAKLAPSQNGEGDDGEMVEGDGDDGEGDDDDDDDDEGDEGDDDDDREEGELSDEDVPMEGTTAVKPPATTTYTSALANVVTATATVEQNPTALPVSTDVVESAESVLETTIPEPMDDTEPTRDAPSPPELPLAGASIDRQESTSNFPTIPADAKEPPVEDEKRIKGDDTVVVEVEVPVVKDEQPEIEGDVSVVEGELPSVVVDEAAIVAEIEEAKTEGPLEVATGHDQPVVDESKLGDLPAEANEEDGKTAEVAEIVEDDLLGNFERHLEDGA